MASLAAFFAFRIVHVSAQMADALTYIRNAWGNVAQPISGNDVASLRQILHK